MTSPLSNFKTTPSSKPSIFLTSDTQRKPKVVHMRGFTSLPLDDDIVDRILTFLPDFPSLGATILSSKYIYNIFKTHPNSILRAVAYNITGPTLPQAMRLLRYTPPDSNDPTPLEKPWLETDPISPITNFEAKSLVENAAVVSSLEDLFSARHKNRSSQMSKLDSTESWQFRVAVYRLMLFAQVFDVDDMGLDLDFQTEIEEEEIIKRKQFLLQFPNYELFAIHSVSVFLREVARWIEIADNSCNLEDYFPEVALINGPRKILEGYQTLDAEPMREVTSLIEDTDNIAELFRGYFAYPLSRVFETRKLKPPATDNTHWKSILKEIQGENDTCDMCNNTHGFDLFNETNWEHLRGIQSTQKWGIRGYLKGNLSQSSSINVLFEDELLCSSTWSYSCFLNEIHALRLPPYDSWSKQDWLCANCIVEIIRTHLHFWLLFRKKQGGDDIPEDCWYGYNCRTQVHSFHHATRLNHLCEPTR